MNKSLSARIKFLLLLMAPAIVHGQAGINADSVQKQLAILHVNVINVVNGKTEPDQTVWIRDKKIFSVGPSKKTKLPAGIPTIDGTGKYLIPGMTDAHIHFFQSGGLYTRPDALDLRAVYPYEKDQQWIRDNLGNQMKRYLACGITTVIDVGGPFSNFTIRKIVNEDSLAPDALVTGPLVSTYLPPNLDKKDPPIIKVNNPEEARELVKKQLPYNPDFIKIWYIVLPNQPATATLPIVKATIEESHRNGLKVAVHATEYETARLAVEAGADILVHSVDDQLLDDSMLKLLVSRKTVYIPTLLVSSNYTRAFTQNFSNSLHDFRYSDPYMLRTLTDIQHLGKNQIPFDYKKLRARLPVPSREDSTMLSNLKKAVDAGVNVVTGTDAGNIGTLHASSYYNELQAMKQAGMSNIEIIRASSINAATGFGREKVTGSIEKGKMADLLLLDKDPLQDLSALENIDLVINRGIPLKPAELLPADPETLVQQQLNAFNSRSLEAFLEPYADDVEWYRFPSTQLGKGKGRFREEYNDLFRESENLHCQLTHRSVQGNIVIDHESITGFRDVPVKATAIYEIKQGKISKVYFIQ